MTLPRTRKSPTHAAPQRVIDKYLSPKLGKKKLLALEYEDLTSSHPLSNPIGLLLLGRFCAGA